MISYGRQYIDQDDVDAVVETLQSDFLTTGPKVEEFERKLCEYTWAKYAVVCGNGTQALHMAYAWLWRWPWDEIIIPTNTFVATANMAILCWATPVFCDIRTDTHNIDETQIEKLITKNTKAIVPVHFASQPCVMNVIWELAKKHNLDVVEDAAHALWSAYDGVKIGNGKSDAVTFSFHPLKPITTCEWWAVMTNNKELYEKMKWIRSHGIQRSERWFNDMTMRWHNYRLPDVQCALGLSQMKKLNNFVKKRNEIAALYDTLFQDIEWVKKPKLLPKRVSGRHLYVITFDTKQIRDTMLQMLRDNGYRVTLHYPPVHINTYYRKNGYSNVSLPVAESHFETCLSLPIFYELTDEHIRKVCDIIVRELT